MKLRLNTVNDIDNIKELLEFVHELEEQNQQEQQENAYAPCYLLSTDYVLKRVIGEIVVSDYYDTKPAEEA